MNKIDSSVAGSRYAPVAGVIGIIIIGLILLFFGETPVGVGALIVLSVSAACLSAPYSRRVTWLRRGLITILALSGCVLIVSVLFAFVRDAGNKIRKINPKTHPPSEREDSGTSIIGKGYVDAYDKISDAAAKKAFIDALLKNNSGVENALDILRFLKDQKRSHPILLKDIKVCLKLDAANSDSDKSIFAEYESVIQALEASKQ